MVDAPGRADRYWFKENCPALRFEAGLVGALARLVPGRVLEPLAVDIDRGWLLSPDGGPILADDATVTSFGRTLTEFATMQRALAGHQQELVATGLPVLPADRTVERFESQLDELARLPRAHPLRAGIAAQPLSDRRRALIAEAVQRLAEVPIPDTLQHNDLHPPNIFAPWAGRLRFFDFGDAVWSHPFCVLDVARHRISQRWNCARSDPRIERLTELYLDGWSDVAPRATLRRLVPPALTIAAFHRYHSWHQLIPVMPDDELRRHAGYAESLAGPPGTTGTAPAGADSPGLR